MMRCPVELIGRYSVIPSTSPRTIACHHSKRSPFLRAAHRAGVTLRSVVTPRPLNLILIDRADDPRVADYLNIRDAQLADGFSPAGPRYMAEGELVVETMLRAARPAESVLLLRSRLETMGSLLAEHLAPQTPVYVASQAVMDAIVGIHLHRGVLALGKRWPLPPLPEVLRDATSLLVLEDLTNHETYFFRERAHLDALRDVVLPRLIAEKSRQPGPRRLTLWSAACATGEEAYTLAMIALHTLTTHGIARKKASGEITLPPDWQLDVIGTDISRQAVRIARDARYTARQDGLSSFRQFPDEFLCFLEDITPPDTGTAPAGRKTYCVKPDTARHVRFSQFNLMNQPPPVTHADVIFCRNVLIYMDIDSQKRIIRTLHQALGSGGSLMLSLVDAMSVPQLFRENRQTRCVIYEKP